MKLRQRRPSRRGRRGAAEQEVTATEHGRRLSRGCLGHRHRKGPRPPPPPPPGPRRPPGGEFWGTEKGPPLSRGLRGPPPPKGPAPAGADVARSRSRRAASTIATS